jgi:uncharacterized protein
VDTTSIAENIDSLGVRVLGALVEKEATTPDNYPLTLNALTAACNQTTNRYPVMQVDEAAVARSLEELARRSLVRQVHRSDSRARRYRHLMVETLKLHPAELAVMCVLMLRGPQTPGEIRTRSARLHEYDDPAQLEITLQSLMTLSRPLVAPLPRQPGQKEARFAHLLSGEPGLQPLEESAAGGAPMSRASRVEVLEDEVRALRQELQELRQRFDTFSRQFQ